MKFKLGMAAGLLAALALSAGVAKAEPVPGGTLRVLVHPEPPHLVLALGQASGTATIGSKIYESLLTYDFDNNPQPGLAKSWEVSEDGLSYTFRLQENVKWHDGEPFTAADVVFTTQEFLQETHPRARTAFSRVETVTTPDDYTVVYKLKERFSPFIYAFEVSSAPIMPEHLYRGQPFDTNPVNENPIGTGPFKFVEWQRGQHVRLEKFEDYWVEGQPYLDGITFHFIPDPTARTIALEQGMVDMAQFDAVQMSDVERLRNNENLVLADKGMEFLSPLILLDMNSRVPPMDDVRFRKAVMHAMDRDFVRDRIFYGQGRVPTGPIASTTRYYDPNVTIYDYNPEKAKALLDEMGLESDADGMRAEIRLIPLPYGEHWTRFGEYLREALSKIGVRVRMENADAATWVQRYTNWDYGMTYTFFYQYADPALGVSRTYLCDNVRKVFLANANGYCNERVDELFELATEEMNETQKQAHYTELQQIITDEVPMGFILELQFPVVMNKDVRDAITTAVGANDNFARTWLDR